MDVEAEETFCAEIWNQDDVIPGRYFLLTAVQTANLHALIFGYCWFGLYAISENIIVFLNK